MLTEAELNIREAGIKETAEYHGFKTDIIEKTSECERGVRIISPTVMENDCSVDIVVYPDDPNLTYDTLTKILEHLKKCLSKASCI